uniref:Uncharacterized protein n=1 Tax=Oryza nivara TaxID=4536 RepID=A0A0E0FHW3_ORYNI
MPSHSPKCSIASTFLVASEDYLTRVCVLCDQQEETIDHILIIICCPEALQLWWIILIAVGQLRCFHNPSSSYGGVTTGMIVILIA